MPLQQVVLADTPEQLGGALADLDDLRVVAVDVERADWKRYWRAAALIQVGGEGRVVLVDPLTITDLAELQAYLEPRVCVLHAMENDLAPLSASGISPGRIEDTAIAAALLGLPTGLETLHAQILGVQLATDKQAMQRADWEARPLTREMLEYAAGDVADLPELWARLEARLEETGRIEWYAQEVVALRAQPPVEDRRRWDRTKGIGKLNPSVRARVRSLWETREAMARATDTAPGRIISDRVLVALAEAPVAAARDLGRRGLRRQSVRDFGDRLVAALDVDDATEPRSRDRRVTDADRALADRLRDIRADRARVLGIQSGVLCPSRTLLAAVLTDPDSPAALRDALGLRPWQWEQLGDVFCEALELNGPGRPEPVDPVTTNPVTADPATPADPATTDPATEEEREDG